jgi:ethanolamine ammonia-lyase small subunit
MDAKDDTPAAVAGDAPFPSQATAGVNIRPDPWAPMRAHTPARIGLGRAGTSLPTREVLDFAASHAQARDAVHIPLDVTALQAVLHAHGFGTLIVTSRAPTREAYLRRPDWGRRLSESSAESLDAAHINAGRHTPAADLVIVVADGLSAVAAQTHAAPLIADLRTHLGESMRLAPIVIATQARVALADEIGERLQARLALILLGERPGLSSPDSLGAYLTWDPKVGRHDADRNCVSNIRPEGLPGAEAARRIAWLLTQARRRGLSGVQLKDDSDKPVLESAGGQALPG